MYDTSVKTYYRTAGKIAIGIFCVWHMFAVFAYTIPGSISNFVSSTLQEYGVQEERADVVEKLRWEIAGPYMLSTSQWQQWNMFSPNPSRTVVTMAVEKQVNDAMWQTIRIADPAHLSWWQRSREVKMLYSLGMDSGEGALERFILPSECHLFGLPEGTKLRLIRNRYLVPSSDVPRDAKFWEIFSPNAIRAVRDQYTCQAS